MNHLAHQIEEVALSFGRRFSNRGPKPPITCSKRLQELTISAVIGSGVRYEVAAGMAEKLVGEPTLDTIEYVASQHRFPNQTRKRLTQLFMDGAQVLEAAIEQLTDPYCVQEARLQLSNSVPGLGPKQSSFLLSCCGYGQDIAVLDRHTIKYMELVGVSTSRARLNSWSHYQDLEARFLRYSKEKDIRADAMDIAIWITMKAAGRRVSSCVQ
jgi:N-glycosylase/DNA lyase